MKKSIPKKTGKISGKDVAHAGHDKDKTLRIILAVVFIVSVGMLLGTVSFTVHRINNLHPNINVDKVISYTELNSSVIVAYSVAGLNGDTDSLKFGKVSQGGGGTRFIIINATERSVVEIYFSGNISGFLSVEKNDYIIEKGSIEKVPIDIDVPSNASNGNYDGKVHVLLLRQ